MSEQESLRLVKELRELNAKQLIAIRRRSEALREARRYIVNAVLDTERNKPTMLSLIDYALK